MAFIVCCVEQQYQIIVDNPTDFDVELFVNDKRHMLYGLETIELSLTNANYRFKVINKNDSLLFFKNIRIMLNLVRASTGKRSSALVRGF